MAKWINSDALDAVLLAVRAADGLWVLPTAPVSYASADGAKLAAVALAPGDFSLGDGAPNGRSLSVVGKNALPVTASGTASHVALVDSGADSILYVTTCPAEPLVSGGTVDVAGFTLRVAEPV